MNVLRGTATAAALCLALAGCTNDADEPASGGARSSASSPTDEPSTGTPAASGPAIKGDVFTVRVPAGWVKNKDFSTEFLDQYSEPSGLQQMYVGELTGEVRPLDDVARDNFPGFAPTGSKRRKTAGDLAGDPAYHFTANNGDGLFAEEFLAVHEGNQVSLGLVLTGTKAERQAIVDSVLASWQWA